MGTGDKHNHTHFGSGWATNNKKNEIASEDLTINIHSIAITIQTLLQSARRPGLRPQGGEKTELQK